MNVEKKKPGFEKRITIDLLLQMRKRFLELPKEMTHSVRAATLVPEFSQFTHNTLEDYSRICTQVCHEVFDMVVAGTISITALAEFSGGWDDNTQKYIAKEFVEQGLTIVMLRTIKQLMREHKNMGYAEAISRAKGEIPINQPRQKKSIDQVLTQIADLGARWRALVEMASEMVRDEEISSGVHEAIIEKAFILRQLVGEQYDAINARVNRWMNSGRKKVKEVIQQGNALPLGQVEIVSPGDSTPKMIDAEFTERDGNETGNSPEEK
jgi:hypothetical protein